MVDLSQLGKLWRKAQDFLKKKQEEEKKKQAASSTQTEEKEQEAPSFQWAENLKEEADARKQDKKNKLTTDSNYQQEQIDKLNSDNSKASWKRSWELWLKQTFKDIWSDWKEWYQNVTKAYEQDIEKAKEDDGKVGFWEYLKASAKDGLRWARYLWSNAVKSVLKTVWWLWDAAIDEMKRESAGWKAVREAQEEKWTYLTDEERKKVYNETYYNKKQQQINDILTKEIDSEDTVKEVASERLASNTAILNKKDEELGTIYNEINDWYNKVAELEAQIAQMDEDRKNGRVSWPERDTNYLATVKALKSTKTSIEEKTNLLYQKLEEYDQLEKEHQLKEFELSPFTDNYYETEAEAQRYRSLFWDKLYKNEDGSVMSQWDQKDKDIYGVLKNLERIVFNASEWVRDENVGKFWSLFGFADEYAGFETWSDYLKNSEKFLNMSYDTFAELKEKLEANYDQLCDTVVNGSWEEVKVLNQDKVATFLKQNQQWLSKLSDYIIEAGAWTAYMDIKFWRYQDWTEWKMLTMWKDLWWLSDLLWSMTSAESKEWVWIFHYDKARDWINQSTGNFGLGDALWQMVAQNPAKTAYICGSMYFAVAGSWVYSMNTSKATQISKLWKLDVLWKANAALATKTHWMLWIYNWTKKTKWVVKMAEGLTNISRLAPSKNKVINKVVDTFARKSVWILDEFYVSLPLDLWLNDKTQTDMRLNLIFNTLWWFGKIQSMNDLRLFSKTLVRQWDAAAMEKYFVDYTGLPEVAKKVHWNFDEKNIIENVEYAINSHIDNVLNTDPHKAAWFMSQYINKNIDSLKRENMDEVEAISNAIVDNGNIGASLSKNRAKNITQALAEAKDKLSKTKNWTDILTIQNTAVAKVKKEFSAMLDSFNVEKLNKLYKRKFAADKIWQWFANFIKERSDATWVPKEDLMLIFMDSMNTRVGKEWASVVDLFNQRVVQGLSDWTIKSSKGAKEWVKWARQVTQTTSDWMWKLLDITNVAESDPEKAAEFLSELEENWLHDTREALKWRDAASIAAEEEKIAGDFEKSVETINANKEAAIAGINARKEEKLQEAEDLRQSVSDVTKKDYSRFGAEDTTLAEVKESWKKIENYAKQISNDPDLLKIIEEEEQKYLKSNWGINYDDIIKQDKERWYKSFEDDEEFMDEVEASGMTLDEYMKKNDIVYDSKREKRAIENWKKENKAASEMRETLPADKRLEIIEQYLKDKYWFDFSKEDRITELKQELERLDWTAEYKERLTHQNEPDYVPSTEWMWELWKLDTERDFFLVKEWEGADVARKLDIKYKGTTKKWQYIMNWDLKSLTPEELESVKEAISKWTWTPVKKVTKELIEKTVNDMSTQIDALRKRIWVINSQLVSWEIDNPYEEFSKLINNYIEDQQNINKVTDWKKTSNENIERIFTKIASDDTSEDVLARYNKILEKLEPAWQDIAKASDESKILKEADELEAAATKTADKELSAAEKAAQKEIAEAEQIKLSLTAEVKKRWLSDRIIKGVNKIIDFFQDNASLIKKTGILDSTRKVADWMSDITQKNFLWSLGDILDSLVKKWTVNSSVINNLAQTIIDWWSASFRKWIISDIKKALKTTDGWIDSVKLQDFAGDLYSKNKTKRDNQIKGNQLDDLVKDLLQEKVAKNMTLTVFDKSNITNAKAANEIASDVIAETTTKIKDPTLAKLNQKLWKQSIDAMILYQRAVDTAALKRWDVAEALAEQAAIKQWQDAVSAASPKRVAKQKKEMKADTEQWNYLKQVDELISNEDIWKAAEEATEESKKVEEWLWSMDEGLASAIKQNEERVSSLSQSQKAAEDVVARQRLTQKEKTLMRFWAVEEASKIMDAVTKWQKPWYIKPEFLDWEWFALLNKLLNWESEEGKEFQLFVEWFIENRKQTQSFWYQLFHSLKNILYNWTDSIKTNSGKFNLNDILKAIPSRITSNIKWKNGWILYDPRVTLTKYLMESNPEETTKLMKWVLTDYFSKALAKDSRAELWRKFLEVFDKQASNLETPEVVADEFMNLYNKIASRMKWYWVDDKVVQDILNPMFYNPLEYIRWVARSTHPEVKSVLKWQAMEDMVVWTVLRKYLWQWNDIPSELSDLYLSTKHWSKCFEKFAGGSIIRNKNALEFWEALWEYYNKLDSLPIWKTQFADWMNKTLSHIVNLWDDVTRKVTVYESLMSPLYDKARRVLWEKKYSKFMDSVDEFLFSQKWWMKKNKELQEWFEWFVKTIKDNWLYDDETKEILDVLNRSLEAKEIWESRVITNFLYDRVSKNADEFMKQTWLTPDKFTPADIMNRKTLQESVMKEYEQKSNEELFNWLAGSERKEKFYEKGKKVEYDSSKKNIKKMVESYWIDAEEAKDIDVLMSDVDVEKLLKDWELSPEVAMKQVLKRMTTNKETFEKLMAENGFFKNWIDDSLQKVFNEKELKAGEEYFSVGKNWEFVLRQQAEQFNWLQRRAAKFTTKWNVMSKDRETQSILAWVDKTRQTAYVHNNIDFGKILDKKDLDLVWRNMSLESYISMWKAGVYKMSKKIKAADRDNIVAEAVNIVFKNLPTPAMAEKMSEPAAKEFVTFLENYKEGIDKARQTLELWDQWKYVFEWVDFRTKWVWPNKLANRLAWMWNYLSTDDVARLSSKYDQSVSSSALWKDFTQNIIYNARADLRDSKFMRWVEKANLITQKYAVLRNYNVTNITKAGQQVASNLYHAQGILKSVSVAGTSEFDELFKFFQNSDMKTLWFDIFESEWKYWERILEKGNPIVDTAANPLDNIVKKTEKWSKWILWTNYRFKDGNVLKNLGLFSKDLATSNALMRWDRVTQKWAVKSSLALATDEIYKLGWAQAVEDFTKKLNKFTDLLDKYGLKERDLMDSDRFFSKATQTLNSKKAMEAVWFTPDQAHKYYLQNKQDMKFIHDFYRNEYAPFMWKARTSMGTFFVMDNIKELGSIQAIDNNKYMFWLMKWSTGKIWEYLFDVWTAFNSFKWTKLWFFEALRAPIFKRIYSEVTEWMRGMWEIEKMTNDEFTIKDWMKATIVPVAAVSMLIWEAIVDWFQKTASSEEWDAGWWNFTKHVISTSLDSAVDFATDRMFIYAGMFGTDVGGSINTASTVWLENPAEFREAFAHTRRRKFYTNNPIHKYQNIKSSWYETSALELIKPETILAEIWLNQTSSARDVLNDINTEIYDLQKNYYEDNNKWYTTILNYVPVIKNAKQAGKDMWVLLPMLDKKVDATWAYGFLKETTSRSELARLINNMEKNAMLSDKSFEQWAMNNLQNINKDDDDAIKVAMIKAWVYKDDLQAWNIVQNWLAKTNQMWKWESALWLATLDEEDRENLFKEFDNMYQTYVIDKDKADVATTSMFDKFVLAATKYGWSMSMAGYMWAYNTAYKAAARKYYWLAASEVTAWNKWDEWLAAEGDIDLSNLPESKYGNYIKYVDEIRKFQQAFIVDNWDILSREKSIWIDMLNKYIETDKDNFWWNSYLGSIGDEKSNMSKLWNTLNYNEISKDQWLPWMIVPLAYQEKKAADWYTLMLSKAKTPEDVALLWEKFLGIQKALWGLADNFVESPQAAGLIKASLASWLVSFADKIEEKSPWMLEKVVDIIGEKAINDVLNTLTDSPTVTMADAFELATGVSAHSWGSGKGKSVSIPSAKARENYVDKMLIPNYNKASAAAGRIWWGSNPDLPKFTTAYGRAKDGSIIATQMPVSTRKKLTELPTNSINTKTAKLDVAPLPVKEWRVIGWKYTARAIQNAKVYSRRIGR